MIARRSFITGFAALVAGPAIVRASSLMQVKEFDHHFYRIVPRYQGGFKIIKTNHRFMTKVPDAITRISPERMRLIRRSMGRLPTVEENMAKYDPIYSPYDQVSMDVDVFGNQFRNPADASPGLVPATTRRLQ